MAVPIPGARPSPRIDRGVLCWYEGDTFTVVLQFDLHDQDGEAVEMQQSDSVEIRFFDETQEPVHTLSFTEVTDNQVTLSFDRLTTAKFKKGKYTYDIRYTQDERTTLARDNRVFVE